MDGPSHDHPFRGFPLQRRDYLPRGGRKRIIIAPSYFR